jgi:DNA-binding transcriptional ArsR family regulator
MNELAETVYVLHAKILKTLAQPKRLMILDHLHGGEKSVGELVGLLGLPQSNVSQHLAALRAGDIVRTRREGNTVYYSLVDPRIVRACDIFHEVLADRMKTNRAFASQFPRLRPLRSADVVSARKAARS